MQISNSSDIEVLVDKTDIVLTVTKWPGLISLTLILFFSSVLAYSTVTRCLSRRRRVRVGSYRGAYFWLLLLSSFMVTGRYSMAAFIWHSYCTKNPEDCLEKSFRKVSDDCFSSALYGQVTIKFQMFFEFSYLLALTLEQLLTKSRRLRSLNRFFSFPQCSINHVSSTTPLIDSRDHEKRTNSTKGGKRYVIVVIGVFITTGLFAMASVLSLSRAKAIGPSIDGTCGVNANGYTPFFLRILDFIFLFPLYLLFPAAFAYKAIKMWENRQMCLTHPSQDGNDRRVPKGFLLLLVLWFYIILERTFAYAAIYGDEVLLHRETWISIVHLLFTTLFGTVLVVVALLTILLPENTRRSPHLLFSLETESEDLRKVVSYLSRRFGEVSGDQQSGQSVPNILRHLGDLQTDHSELSTSPDSLDGSLVSARTHEIGQLQPIAQRHTEMDWSIVGFDRFMFVSNLVAASREDWLLGDLREGKSCDVARVWTLGDKSRNPDLTIKRLCVGYSQWSRYVDRDLCRRHIGSSRGMKTVTFLEPVLFLLTNNSVASKSYVALVADENCKLDNGIFVNSTTLLAVRPGKKKFVGW